MAKTKILFFLAKNCGSQSAKWSVNGPACGRMEYPMSKKSSKKEETGKGLENPKLRNQKK